MLGNGTCFRTGGILTFSSGDELLDDCAVHVCQSEVAAGLAEGQLLVAESQQVKERGVQVVNMGGFFHGLGFRIYSAATGFCYCWCRRR